MEHKEIQQHYRELEQISTYRLHRLAEEEHIKRHEMMSREELIHALDPNPVEA